MIQPIPESNKEQKSISQQVTLTITLPPAYTEYLHWSRFLKPLLLLYLVRFYYQDFGTSTVTGSYFCCHICLIVEIESWYFYSLWFPLFMQHIGQVATRWTYQLPTSIKRGNTFSSTQQRNHVKPMTYEPPQKMTVTKGRCGKAR
jgi:hypothetical protein